MNVYACKIGEKKFGQPGRLASALSVTVPTNQLDYCFTSGQAGVTKRQLTDTVFHRTVATSVRGTVWHITVAISL